MSGIKKMGGKQSIPRRTQEYIPQDAQRYKRFCSVCHKQTYDWSCCGKRTRRLKTEYTIQDKIPQGDLLNGKT